MPKSKDKIKHLQTRVDLEEHQVINTQSSDYPGTFPDDLATKWTLARFEKDVEFRIIHEEGNNLEFDLIGADAALANSLRRIILVEVPTMAVEKVFIYNNTSIMQDEVLAHRLGLIPIKADPRLFEYRQEGQEESSAEDTLTFGLKIKCSHNPKSASDATKPDDLYLNNNVYSKHINWLPIGNQSDLFKEPDVLPVDDDILITKLRPGQIIDLRMEAYKGIGQDHIKFSPVATVSYRLLPEIAITQPITGKLVNKFKDCFSPGVIGVKENQQGEEEAFVIDSRLDTNSRNVFRHDELKDRVRISSVRNHYIFSVESTGALSPRVSVKEALKLLIKKSTDLRTFLEAPRDE